MFIGVLVVAGFLSLPATPVAIGKGWIESMSLFGILPPPIGTYVIVAAIIAAAIYIAGALFGFGRS